MAGPRPQRKRRPAEAAVDADNGKQTERPTKPTEKGEEDFPRGGADTLTAWERRELTEAARKEVEQELADGKQPKSKKARFAVKDGDEEDAFFGKQAAALEGKLAKHVDLLRVKTLHAGTKLWGMVLEVTPRGLVVSLPHGLRGVVAPNRASDVLALMLKAQAASDSGRATESAARKKGAALLEAVGGAPPPLTDLFVVGQFVRCVVAEEPAEAPSGAAAAVAGGGRSSKHVALSLLLRDVQAGLGSESLVEGLALGAVVRSVEDHGYVLSFGVKGTSGFLRKKDHEAQFGEGVALQVGGLLDVVIRNATDKRNVLVSCSPGEVAGAVTHGSDGLTGLDGLLPGALLNVKVRKVLSNGLLVSFLTFFHGTIDTLHIPAATPAAAAAGDWRKAYSEGAKLRARLLYVDPGSKRAGLSLLPHLMALTLPSPVPMLGSVFPEAAVVRVDAAGGPGLLLRLEGLPEGAVAGYCHVANALEEKVPREAAVAELNKKFKPGTKLPARVIGYRLMDGMASVTVRPSQVNASVLSYADLIPGMVVSGTVVSVPDRDGDGPLLIAVAEGVKGLVPPLHGAELAAAAGEARKPKGRVKVKVGEKVEARVLDVDAASRKLTLTLRKALLGAKAAPLASAAQAVPGARFHGVVTGFHDRLGVFVSFFGGMSGVAPHDQLGLEAGQSAKDAFAIGQIVKATILSAAAGRIKLSLASKTAAAAAAAAAAIAAPGSTPAKSPATAANGAAAADPLAGLQPGDIAEAVVAEVHVDDGGGGAETAAAAVPYYLCRLDVPGGPAGGVRARLEVAHLSDHPVATEAFRTALRPGSKLGRVVVLERLEGQRCVRISRKPALVAAAAAGALPKTFADVREGAVLPGFVASVTPDAVYVRFLGGLTGRAGLPQLSDVFVSDPRQLFSEGQSVRAQVATCDAARQRFTVLLRPSATASTDGAYLLDYLREMQRLQELRAEAEATALGGAPAAAAAAADPDPAKLFRLGGLAAARVHEVKEYGIVCDMDDHPDLVGLVPSSHAGAAGSSPGLGSRVQGRVLDVVGHQGLVELSLKPEMVAAAKHAAATKEAAKKLKLGTTVDAVVEGIRPGEYLILSLPSHASLLAYAAVTDFNTPRTDLVPRSFTVGQRVSATVAVVPPEAPAGRIICHVPLTRVGAAADGRPADGKAAGGEAGKKQGGGSKVTLTPGSVVEAVVTGIQPHQLDVSIGGGKATGRIHVTEVVDVDVKALLAAAAAAAAAGPDRTAAPPAAKKARKAEPAAAAAPAPGGSAGRSPLDGFRLEQNLEAVVLGRLQGGEGHKHGVLDLSLRPSRLAIARKGEPQVPPVTLAGLVPGQQLLCFVLEVGEDALWVGAGPAVRGRVATLDASLDPDVLTDLAAAFPPGTPVVARVLAVNAKRHTLDLSLLDPCSGTTHGSVPTGGAAAGAATASAPPPPDGALVMGRVTAASGGGVRVSLGHRRAGSVALTDIHDSWVPDALAGIKEGAYVRVRVLGRDGEFAVLSLRPSRGGAVAGAAAASAASKAAAKAEGKAAVAAKKGAAAAAAAAPEAQPAAELLSSESLQVGQTVSGYVKRCDVKGLFLALDRYRDGRIKLGNLSDGFIEDPAAAFPPGLRLEARVAQLGEDGRVELTLRSATRRPAGSAEASIQSISELREGQLVSGRVRRVERFGVFVEVEGNPAVVGLAHVSELADGPVHDINAAFKAKQSVRAVVTKVDVEAKRLSLSLKPSKLKEAEAAAAAAAGGGKGAKRRRATDIDDEIAEVVDDAEEEEEDDEAAEDAEGEEEEEEAGSSDEEEEGEEQAAAVGSDVDVDDVEVSSEEEEEEEEGGAIDDDDDGEDGEDEGGSEEEEEEEEERTALGRRQPGAGTSTGNLDLTAPWGELLLADDPRVGQQAAAALADGPEDGRKLSKGAKKRLKEQREQEIRAAELARLSGTAAPTTPADFERLVLASPNSSFVWIKYMALHISLGDVDAARKVAQRALGAINYREEGEKFNVWVALLNLENAYGTSPSPEEAAMEALRKALQYTDQKKMYMAALGIFERSGRDELADQVTRTLTKKFGGSAKVWAKAIERELQKGDDKAASKLLERSLQSLPARKHVKVLVRTALAEFRLGSAERGRGVLEGILRNYPRRLDVWNVYIDQELKTGEQPRIRALFERATHLPLPPKKMKFLFKRYLEYEKSEGDAAAVEHVKRRAMEFVESSLKA